MFILFIELVLIHEISFSQRETNDTSNVSHFVYVVPTSLPGSLGFDFDNFWTEIGYGFKYNRSMYTLGIGTIVHSIPHSSSGAFFGGISSIRASGVNTNIEYKYVFVKKFYCSVQLNYEYIETVRREKYLNEFNQELTSDYKVFRNEIALIPRIGFVFLKRNKLSCDVNIGTGIRYIWSTNAGKKNLGGNLDKEFLTKKEFDSGQKFAQRLSFQFRIGYAF